MSLDVRLHTIVALGKLQLQLTTKLSVNTQYALPCLSGSKRRRHCGRMWLISTSKQMRNILQTVLGWSKSKIQAGPHAGHALFDEHMPPVISANSHMILPMDYPPPMMSPGSSISQKGDLSSLLLRLQTALQKYGATKVLPANPEPSAQKPSAAPSTRSQPLQGSIAIYSIALHALRAAPTDHTEFRSF
jgi:hypothetical protein